MTTPLTAEALRALAQRHDGAAPCPSCAPLACPGWEAFPGSVPKSALRQVGSLRADAYDEPTLEEYHPGGTDYWSPRAPIAPAFHPYNRCDVWACAQCGRPFVLYTEYGGYYEEKRIRAVDAALVTDATPAG
jgi:hypothetical protein